MMIKTYMGYCKENWNTGKKLRRERKLSQCRESLNMGWGNGIHEGKNLEI
jgi:hypothetical protein